MSLPYRAGKVFSYPESSKLLMALCRIKLMNDDLQKTLPDTKHAEGDDRTSDIKPQPLSLSFIIALALVGLLVLLILFVNLPGIKASAGISMTRSDWTLQSYADVTGTLVTVKPGTPVTAIFADDATVSGSAGCNLYRANYTVRDFAISVSTPVSTKIVCNDPNIMQQDSVYLEDLVRSEELRISETNLIFYDESGKPVLVFVKG
jgi:heat shock protein HslJ